MVAEKENLFQEEVSEELKSQELSEEELENVSGGGPSGRHR